MSEKKITYLIGAGASANALPVVNGMNERMEFFLNDLIRINNGKHLGHGPDFIKLRKLLEKIITHKTIDTYAKKLHYKEDLDNYNLLKRFLICYLLFEQSINGEQYYFDNHTNNFVTEENKKTLDKISKRLDERYDSFLASLLNNDRVLNQNINIVSWNYDLQFELSYADFFQTKYSIDELQDKLQVFPRSLKVNNIDKDKSSIIKINGTGNFRDFYVDAHTSVFDIINEAFFDERFIEILLKVLFMKREGVNVDNQLKFAWEKDEQVTKARNYSHEVIRDSDAVVIIGYSFPTFNRDIDRLLFSGFNKDCLMRSAGKIELIKKKIYIQDKPENAPKIKERLKAVGNNLFDVAEIYDDVDQFFIPPEL